MVIGGWGIFIGRVGNNIRDIMDIGYGSGCNKHVTLVSTFGRLCPFGRFTIFGAYHIYNYRRSKRRAGKKQGKTSHPLKPARDASP